MTEVEICNLANSKLGNGENAITALTDSTVTARACNRWYAAIRDMTLAEYGYPVTRKTVALKLRPGGIRDIVYFDDYDMFVAVGDDGVILTSIGDDDWTLQKSGVSTNLNALCIFGTLLVAVGNKGVILTSSNGTTWTSRTSGTTKHLYGVGVNSTTAVVAVGAVGIILSSTDGTTWTARTSNVATNLRDVVYGNSTYCVVGDNGVIVTATTLSTWTLQTSGVTEKLYSVTYGMKFVVGGADGRMLISTDAAAWTASVHSTGAIYKARYVVDTYFICAAGYVLISTDASSWSDQGLDNDGEYRAIAYSTNDMTWVVLGNQIGYTTESLVAYTGSESYVELETLTDIGVIYSSAQATEWTEIDFMAGYGWDYVYIIPQDFLNIIGVNDDGTETISETITFAKVEGYLCTDCATPIYVVYSRQITDTTNFSYHLCNAMAARLAVAIAPDVKGHYDTSKLLGEYVTAIREARGVEGSSLSRGDNIEAEAWTNAGR